MNKPPSRLRHLKPPLLLIYVLFVITFVFKENPAFFESVSLLSQLTNKQSESLVVLPSDREQKRSIPLPPPELPEKLGQTYYRQTTKDFVNSHPELKPKKLHMDEQGFYFLSDNNTLYSTNFLGEVLWSFSLDKDSKDFSGPPAIGKHQVILSTKSGKLFILNKTTGKIDWFLHLNISLEGTPFLTDGGLFLTHPTDDSKSFQILKVDTEKGIVSYRSKKISVKKTSPFAYDQKHNRLLFGAENGGLYSFDADNGKIKWKFQTSGIIRGRPLVHNNLIVIANEEGDFYGIQLSRGREKWKFELTAGTDQAVVYIPEFNYGAVYVNNEYIHVVDLNTGESVWRYNTHNAKQNKELIAVQLNSKAIMKLQLPWSQKGWTLWSACGNDRICIFNPKNGQVTWRVRARGQLLSSLHYSPQEKIFYAIVQDEEADNQVKLAKFAEYISKKKSSSETDSLTTPKKDQ